MWETLRNRPVEIVAAVQATLAVAVLFGLPLTENQLAGLVIAVGAWLALFTAKQTASVRALNQLRDAPPV